MTAIYLASRSPRRHELLTQMRVAHHILHLPTPPGEDEPRLPGESPAAYVQRTACDKAERGVLAVRERKLEPCPVLSADTTVILGDNILGKPLHRNHAVQMLQQLSGTRHEVRTALALAHNNQLYQAVSSTWVWFKPLTEHDIQRYCDTNEPYDKAGGYGIQGLAGVFVQHLEGSYTGVMGLPLYETAQLLANVGVVVP